MWSATGNAFWAPVSGAQPFIQRGAGLAQDSPNEPGIDGASGRIWNRQAKAAPAHPLVLSSRERPFETQGLQLADQLTP